MPRNWEDRWLSRCQESNPGPKKNASVLLTGKHLQLLHLCFHCGPSRQVSQVKASTCVASILQGSKCFEFSTLQILDFWIREDQLVLKILDLRAGRVYLSVSPAFQRLKLQGHLGLHGDSISRKRWEIMNISAPNFFHSAQHI